ncbi:MAG: nuclease, partial [Bacteroidota bacterium]|nr:nuclease [Bacteroidota bacterium]
MKKILLLLLLPFIAFSQSQTASNLYFSEYGEGSSNNKYFEVYNASNDTVDLSGYAYPSVANAPSTPGQ